MDSIAIKGGRALKGSVRISGAKNAALPILMATLLADDCCHLENVPRLRDINTTSALLEIFGSKINRIEPEDAQAGWIFEIDPRNINNPEAPYELVRTMRASILALGPLLARFGKARVSLPGGCAIGARPVNLHLDGLRRLGAEISVDHGYINAKAKKLRGNLITFDTVTVTGTENLIMAACLAEGQTIIENAAREPEVYDLCCFLKSLGADIEGAGSDRIIISGVKNLLQKDKSYRVIPDRIEAGTFLVAGAITKGEITIQNCLAEHLEAVLAKLHEVGCQIQVSSDGTQVSLKSNKVINGIDVTTNPYPGFPTDMQAQMMALLSLAEGTSTITETIFENRFLHALELNRMGANIKIMGSSAEITGVKKLSAAQVMATDLRASASLILAGLAAEGETTVSRVYHIDRGYEKIELKLASLGADIKRIQET